MQNAVRVLVVEDDAAIADALVYSLRREGMYVDVADTLAGARAHVAGADVVILDLGLPDGSGYSLLAARAKARVIVLTSRDEELECVAALEAGADDYVTKPFSPRELVARVRAVARRGVDRAPSGLVVDAETRKSTWNGAELPLTKIEFDLLAVLADAPSRVRTREQLVARVWGDDYALAERTVDSHLKALRKKLSDAGAPSLVETVRGVGFRLREAP